MRTAVTPTELPAQDCRADEATVNELLDQIGSKWTMTVITRLSHGQRRFSDLRRQIDGISQRALTSTLRYLERDGLVDRIVTPTIPPRVDYRLTALGRELCEPLQQVAKWAVDNRPLIERARQAFEAAMERKERQSW